MTRTKTPKLAMPAGVVFALLLVSSQALASPCTLTGPNFNGAFFIVGTGTLSNLSMMGCTSITQQDKVWSNFTFPASLVGTSAIVAFNFSVVNGHDVHTITVSAPFGSLGTTTAYSYTISVVPSSTETFALEAADLLQTMGTSTFATNMTDNHGNTYSTSFIQVGTTVTGTTSTNFLPGTTSLTVTDESIDTTGGSNATAAANSFTEVLPIPETGALALFGSGVLGLAGILRYKRSRQF